MPLPRWYRSLFRLYPRRFREDAELDLTEMAEAELESGRSGARLLADHLLTLARAWVQAIGHLAHPRTRSALVDGLRLDLRFGWRSLLRTPAFLVVSTVVIGIGIGATTT